MKRVLRRSLLVYTPMMIVIIVFTIYRQPIFDFLFPGGWGWGESTPTITREISKDANGEITGFIETTESDDAKSVWDVLSLLGVPLTLALLGFFVSRYEQRRATEEAARQRELATEETKRQQERAAEEAKEEVLQLYFDRISSLLIDKNLRAIAEKREANPSEEDQIDKEDQDNLLLLEASVDMIRSRTLSILRRFKGDGDRKASVIRFLFEAEILSKLKLSVRDADLQEVNLSEANLEGANLEGANLQGANLSWANLRWINLQDANLERANLSWANLRGANLQDANLERAVLQVANLQEADLQDANLEGAVLWSANLQDANLERAEVNLTLFSKESGISKKLKSDLIARGALIPTGGLLTNVTRRGEETRT